jgi:hypothetical protein
VCGQFLRLPSCAPMDLPFTRVRVGAIMRVYPGRYSPRRLGAGHARVMLATHRGAARTLLSSLAQPRVELVKSACRGAVRIAILCATTWPGVVRAAPDDSMATSNALFDEGKKLLAEACSRFEESYRLQPRGGTLLNLALCHEAEGKLVTAWRELGEALAAAQQGGREDRIPLAATHLTAVEARLSWLTIVPPPNVKEKAMSVTLDRAPVDRSLFAALPLEAGEHVVSVAAPGFRARSMSLTTRATPERQTLRFDALDSESVCSASSVGASGSHAEGPSSSTPQKVGLVAAATGVAGIGLGTYFGLRAMGKKSDATANGCDDNGGCPPGAGMETWRSARSNATVSTISFVIGGALLAGGAAMYLAGGRAKPRSATIKAAPSASAHDLGLLVQGTF